MKNTKQSIGRPPTEECKSCFGKGYYYNDDDDWRDPDGGVSVRRCPDDECVHGKEWEETKNREEQEAEERWVRNGGRLPGQNVKENKMNITKEYLIGVIKEEMAKVLRENVDSLTQQQRRYIAAATEPAEVPEDHSGIPDYKHPSLLSWKEDPGEFQGAPDDDWGQAEHGVLRDSWDISELKVPPRKFPEAELGWYVIERKMLGDGSAVAGPFVDWEAAAYAADEISGRPRENIYDR